MVSLEENKRRKCPFTPHKTPNSPYKTVTSLTRTLTTTDFVLHLHRNPPLKPTKTKKTYKMKTAKEHIQVFENITDKDVSIFENISEMPDGKNIQVDSYVAIICTAGKAFCKQNGIEINIGKNDFLLCHPNAFVDNIMINLDFKCIGMVMSPSYFEAIFFVDGNYWDLDVAIKRTPVIHLKEEEADNFVFNATVLKKKLQQTELPHHAQLIKHLLQSLLFEFYDYLVPHLQLSDSQYKFSSAEAIFKRFAQMLSRECPTKRNLQYYADQLCITPKYLSTICKKQCGKTAGELINGITVNYISNMLTSSDKSVKEIATEAGFDNLSFFGKYVRREMGVSPRQFRAQNTK